MGVDGHEASIDRLDGWSSCDWFNGRLRSVGSLSPQRKPLRLQCSHGNSGLSVGNSH